MAKHCYNCNEPIELSSSGTVGRKEECPACREDLHCCMNCKFYDQAAYNECAETQAERVLEKTRGNFCDYFSFQDGSSDSKNSQKSDTLKDLDSLFK